MNGRWTDAEQTSRQYHLWRVSLWSSHKNEENCAHQLFLIRIDNCSFTLITMNYNLCVYIYMVIFLLYDKLSKSLLQHSMRTDINDSNGYNVIQMIRVILECSTLKHEHGPLVYNAMDDQWPKERLTCWIFGMVSRWTI